MIKDDTTNKQNKITLTRCFSLKNRKHLFLYPKLKKKGFDVNHEIQIIQLVFDCRNAM